MMTGFGGSGAVGVSTIGAASGASALSMTGAVGKTNVKARLRRSGIVRAPLAILVPLTALLTLLARHGLPGASDIVKGGVDTGAMARLAFYIHVTNGSILLLPRLMEKIHHVHNIHLIHFDQSIPPSQTEAIMTQITHRLPSLQTIHILPPQLTTPHGISTLLNTLSAMSYLLRTDTTWHYFINLSAADYPLLPAHLQRRLLSHAVPHASNFLTTLSAPAGRALFSQHARNFHVDRAVTHMQPDGLEQLPGENPLGKHTSFDPAASSPYMMLSRQFVHFAATSNLARLLLPSVGYIRSPDEHFFATLAANSARFNGTVIPTAFRLLAPTRGDVEARYLDDESVMIKPSLLRGPSFFAHRFRRPDAPLMLQMDALAESTAHHEAAMNAFLTKCDKFWRKMSVAV